MQRSRVVVLGLALATVSAGCYKIMGFPNYGKPIYLAVVVHKGTGRDKCTTRTIPQYQPVRQNDDLVWEVVGDSCGEVTIKFDDPRGVQVDNNSKPKKGKAIGPCGRYKYSVLIGKDKVEDPEIDIWP